jgi:hypothetical protein
MWSILSQCLRYVSEMLECYYVDGFSIPPTVLDACVVRSGRKFPSWVAMARRGRFCIVRNSHSLERAVLCHADLELRKLQMTTVENLKLLRS